MTGDAHSAHRGSSAIQRARKARSRRMDAGPSWLAREGRRAQHLDGAGRATSATARAITDDRKRGIRFYGWMPTAARTCIYVQDEGGTEDWHVYARRVVAGAKRATLRRYEGVQRAACRRSAWITRNVLPSASTTATRPGTTSTASTSRTGERELVFENRRRAVAASCSIGSSVRSWPSKTRDREGGRIALSHRRARSSSRSTVVEHEDDLTTAHHRLHARWRARSTGISSVGRDKAALVATDWQSGTERRARRAPQGRRRQRARRTRRPTWSEAVGARARDARLDRRSTRRMAADLKHLHGPLPGEIECRRPHRATTAGGSWWPAPRRRPPPITSMTRTQRRRHRAVRHPARSSRPIALAADARRDHPGARRPRAGVAT